MGLFRKKNNKSSPNTISDNTNKEIMRAENAIKQGDLGAFMELNSLCGITADSSVQDLGKVEHYAYLVINQCNDSRNDSGNNRGYAMATLGLIFGSSFPHADLQPNSFENLDLCLYWLYLASLNGFGALFQKGKL